MMNQIVLTQNGRLYQNDYRSIHRAILVVLEDKPKSMYELVTSLRKDFSEFRNTDVRIISMALHELCKNKMVVSTYRD